METVALGILFLGLIAGAFVLFSVAIGSPLAGGPRRYNRAKLSEYECGIEPTPQPVGGGRFPIKYYQVAMLFIIFDIELVFLLPWAIAFDFVGLWGLGAVLLFILTSFVIADLYVWRRGALEWD